MRYPASPISQLLAPPLPIIALSPRTQAPLFYSIPHNISQVPRYISHKPRHTHTYLSHGSHNPLAPHHSLLATHLTSLASFSSIRLVPRSYSLAMQLLHQALLTQRKPLAAQLHQIPPPHYSRNMHKHASSPRTKSLITRLPRGLPLTKTGTQHLASPPSPSHTLSKACNPTSFPRHSPMPR